MLGLAIQSLGRHLAWFFRSLRPGGPDGAPWGLRRFAFLLLGFPLFTLLQLGHWAALWLDELLFPAYRKVEVKAPVFIAGIPRSGTTFVHRVLASDAAHFTTVSTWEAVLAPSIVQRKILRALARLDRGLGGHGHRLLNRWLGQGAGDFQKIHEVGLDAPEEDYLWLLPAGSCFILLLAFPFSPWLGQMARFEALPATAQAPLLGFYRRCIQRHLFCHPQKRFLSKNAAFASWLPALRRVFPDASFVLCVREPACALSSQLSSLAPARKLFGTDPTGRLTQAQFEKIFAANYALLAEFVAEGAGGGVAVLDQSDLKADSKAMLNALIQQLALPASPARQAALDALPQGRHRSGHQHAASEAFCPEALAQMASAYERLQQCPARLKSEPPPV